MDKIEKMEVRPDIEDHSLAKTDHRSEMCDLSLETTYNDNLGSYGNMFDIHTFTEISLYQFDFYTDVTHEVYYELYSKPNSFKEDDGKNDIISWTLIKQGSAVGAGPSRGTSITKFGNLTIPADSTHAFYITLNTSDIRYRNIESDMPDAVVGSPLVSSEDVEIRVGVSVAEYPMGRSFFGKRAWCGTLHYLAHRACPSEVPSANPTEEPSPYHSSNPSNEPSTKIHVETTEPSRQSEIPSYVKNVPSLVPTHDLSLSNQPSVPPTLEPSYSPTLPADSLSPSLSESESPSVVSSLTSSPTQLEQSSQPSIAIQNRGESNFLLVPPTRRPTEALVTRHPSSVQFERITCKDHHSTATTFMGGTGAYGNMFTVTSKEEPLVISTVSFHTDFDGDVTVEVYTKLGNFVGFENKPSSWTQIARSKIHGVGEGQGTMVPRDHFEPIAMIANSTISLYVTLTTADIRYTRMNVSLGQPLVSDKFLDINAGAGLADYPFSSEYFLYVPRSFNGIVHFDVDAECLLTADVIYSFNVQAPKDFNRIRVLQLVEGTVQRTIERLFSTEDTLLNNAQQSKAGIDKTIAKENPTDSCVPLSTTFVCLSIDAIVTIKHDETADGDALKFDLLSFRKEVTLGVQLIFQTSYIGDQSSSARLRLTLGSKDEVKEIGTHQEAAFERATKEFFKEMLKDSGITILSVTTEGQSVISKTRQLNIWERFLNDGIVAELEINAIVKAKYRPPPDVEFNKVVDEVVQSSVPALTNRIKRADPGFQNFQKITFETETVEQPTQAPVVSVDESYGLVDPRWGGIFLMGIIMLIAFLLLCLYCFNRRMRVLRQRKYGDIVQMEGEDQAIIQGSEDGIEQRFKRFWGGPNQTAGGRRYRRGETGSRPKTSILDVGDDDASISSGWNDITNTERGWREKIQPFTLYSIDEDILREVSPEDGSGIPEDWEEKAFEILWETDVDSKKLRVGHNQRQSQDIDLLGVKTIMR